VRALELYAAQPGRVRFHTRVRAWTAPIHELAERAPDSGRMLEVGCGHGLFSNEAALLHPELEVLGVDPAGDKIEAALASVGERERVRFRQGTLEHDVPEEGFDAIAILDVLYLVPFVRWPEFLNACFVRLRPGGRLLLKEVDTEPRWKFWRCYLQEVLSVRLLGITRGGGFAFAHREEMRELLHAAGFWDVCVTLMDRGYLTPHVLYEGIRPE
jgi:2-polyprenyl-6-hydroxyphenyl methylase/3-demethylubiquinone-9 3-methyltransferase